MAKSKETRSSIDQPKKPLLVPVIDSGNATQDARLYNEILEAILDHRLSPDVRKAREVLGARRLIENQLVKEATLAATAESLDSLRRCVEDERDQVCRQHVGSGLRLSGDFHIQLSKLSGNSTLMGYLKELVPQTSLIIATYQSPNHTQCAHQEHFDIIEIVASGDVEAAQEAMSAHLQSIEEKLHLDKDRSPNDLYAAFSHLMETTSN